MNPFKKLSLFALVLLLASCSKDDTKINDNNNDNDICLLESIFVDNIEYDVTLNNKLISKIAAKDGVDESTTCNYNDKNQLVSLKFLFDGVEYSDTIIYNSQGKIDKYVSYLVGAGHSKIFEMQFRFEYDASNKLVKEIDSSVYNDDVTIYEYKYTNDKISSYHAYDYNYSTKKKSHGMNGTIEYTNIKNPLKKYGENPSFIFIGSLYEVLDTEYLFSKVVENHLEDDFKTVWATDIYEYNYSQDTNGNITSFDETFDGKTESLLKLKYNCK